MHEALYGELEVENQHELDCQREHHRSLIKDELSWIEVWSADEGIRRWLKEFSRKKPTQRGAVVPTIFSLLGSKGDTVRDRLKELEIGFAYTHYAHASQMLHGSSALQFLSRSPNELGPDFGLPVGDEDAVGRGTADCLLRVIASLNYLKRRLWAPGAA